jgi:tRNA nucleotidyltransferase (CCA-adding enzyme)
MAKFYQVGGCVRDRLLGVQSKDIDFSVEAESYEAMRRAVIIKCGGDPENPEHAAEKGPFIKVDKPEFVTIRAIDPVLGGVDFVLCRKDGTYNIDGRRPDFVEVGTLYDDLARRDFTVNAMAEAEDGSLIDPFNGRWDLENRTLRCVGDTRKRLTEDSLRMLRAIRFSITKMFALSRELEEFLSKRENAELLNHISIERIREELLKCFEFDTLHTLRVLENFRWIRTAIFERNLKLTPTITCVK